MYAVSSAAAQSDAGLLRILVIQDPFVRQTIVGPTQFKAWPSRAQAVAQRISVPTATKIPISHLLSSATSATLCIVPQAEVPKLEASGFPWTMDSLSYK